MNGTTVSKNELKEWLESYKKNGLAGVSWHNFESPQKALEYLISGLEKAIKTCEEKEEKNNTICSIINSLAKQK